MKSLNRIELKGTVGSEPRISKVGNGTVGNISVATEYAYQNKGEWVSEVTWLNVVVWEGFGRAPLEEIHKGSKVFVSGRLRSRKYTNKDGVDVMIYEVLAEDFDLITDVQQQQKDRQVAKPEKKDDDLPF